MNPAASPHTVTSPLETTLRAAVSSGRKLLVPYLTGGICPDWTDYLRAAQRAGADAIEIGLPFSDPTLDGATIQQASDQALRAGTTVDSILADLDGMDLSVPLVAMTYANLVLHRGAEDFCRRLGRSGISGLIVPDLPVDEAAQVTRAAERHGVDMVLWPRRRPHRTGCGTSPGTATVSCTR